MKIAKNFELTSLHVSDKEVFDAKNLAIAKAGIVNFSPFVMTQPSLSTRDEFLLGSQLANAVFSSPDWSSSF
jgi:hypothetical protein